MPRKTSIIHDKEKVLAAIAVSNSVREVIAHLGLGTGGGTPAALKLACQEMGLELPKYDRTKSNRDYSAFSKKVPDEEVFIENSTYTNRTRIKERMFALGIPNVCSCGQGPFWNGKPLTLTLEHKNGISNDNRLENLEILCGHCHSQTETFAGRNSKTSQIAKRTELLKNNNAAQDKLPLYDIKQPKSCNDCKGNIINDEVNQFNECLNKFHYPNRKRYNTQYPELDELINQVQSKGYVKTAESIGVTDHAVRKHLKKFLPLDHPIFNKKKK